MDYKPAEKEMATDDSITPFSITLIAFLIRSTFDSCSNRSSNNVSHFVREGHEEEEEGDAYNEVNPNDEAPTQNPLDFMMSKLVLLVSHELSLSGGTLLLMELAFLLRGVGADVVWVFSARGQEAVDTALKADLIVLNTAVAGKWLDAVLKEHVADVLPKVLWWIHEMREHYIKLEYVKQLPFVGGAMIDSQITTLYWKNRTKERLG
ncbi:Peroxidase superfamily protein [Hibiscus syriacus]|uniref:Peroxidase superfamily protein n=1 Tax=Hibiscus syriacus TaxID=106335 RepID=A0A6A2XDB1_HIBSY|nr:Peroxidase superfamily protein [Hibiscus syriacus]